MKRNPTSPWNPADPVAITPGDYEKEVLKWLSKFSGNPEFHPRLSHRSIVRGHSGEYQIDVVGEFSVFGGAVVKVLVECKRHNRPVERDDVAAFATKIQDTASHKGMMFSTAGFQKGAIELAGSKGIATLTFIDGGACYETRSWIPTQTPPNWLDLPEYGICFLRVEGTAIRTGWVTADQKPIVQWILG